MASARSELLDQLELILQGMADDLQSMRAGRAPPDDVAEQTRCAGCHSVQRAEICRHDAPVSNYALTVSTHTSSAAAVGRMSQCANGGREFGCISSTRQVRVHGLELVARCC